MIKSLFTPVLFAVSTFLFAFSFSSQADNGWIQTFAKQVEKANRKEKIPGYAFAVVLPNADPIIVTHGVTHKNGQAINKDTIFRLASVSKTFTSVLTSKLVDEGQMSWELPLQELVPDVEFDNQLGGQMTLSHILSQSSGYMPNAYDNLIEANYSVDRVLRQLAKLDPICPPGKCYTYQNTLFAAVDKGFNNQTKKSFSELLEQQLFEPLEMGRSGVGLDALIQDENWARPHVLVRNGKYSKTRVKPSYYRYASASGVNASISDMSKWLKMMLGHYPTVLSQKQIGELISPKTKTTKELHRRHWIGHLNEAHYGLGWRVYDFEGEQLIHHGGWVSGYRADISFAPEYGVGLVFLMNAESNLMNKLRVDFWDQAFEHAEKKVKPELASVSLPKFSNWSVSGPRKENAHRDIMDNLWFMLPAQYTCNIADC